MEEANQMRTTVTTSQWSTVKRLLVLLTLCLVAALNLIDRQLITILLEPIMAVEVTTPEEYQGDLIGDINRRRGSVSAMENKAGACIITATVPLELLFGYVTDIRSLSKGRASASITPSHFEQVPNSLLSKIVESSSKAPART